MIGANGDDSETARDDIITRVGSAGPGRKCRDTIRDTPLIPSEQTNQRQSPVTLKLESENEKPRTSKAKSKEFHIFRFLSSQNSQHTTTKPTKTKERMK